MRIATAAVALVLMGVSVTGCGDGGGSGAPDEVTGVVIDIESEGIGEVESFRLKDGDETYEIRIDPQRDYGFSLGHLHEHLQTSDPVVVELESRDGFLFGVTIEDAT